MEYVKGSSKPKDEKTLKMLVREKITPQLVFRKGSTVVNVTRITDINISLKFGQFLDHNKDMWNSCYRGEAQIEETKDDGRFTQKMKIYGYVQIKDNKVVKISDVVYID